MNPGMRMYLMTNSGEPNRMAAEDGKYQERGIGMDEQGYPLPYHEPRPEFGETEARYRGDDGRWKAGTRRSEYNEGEMRSAYSGGYERHRNGEEMRNGGQKRRWEVSLEPKNYQSQNKRMAYMPKPHMNYMEDEEYDDPPGRVIGFGVPRNHYGGHQPHHGMHKGMHSMEEAAFGKEEAMEWVEGMENEDTKKPTGPMWDEAFVKPLAQKVGEPTDGPEFWEFYAIINALHSDFCKALAEFNADHPMCYAKLAKAWRHDKDAVDNKTQVYWECIVKPKMYEEA